MKDEEARLLFRITQLEHQVKILQAYALAVGDVLDDMTDIMKVIPLLLKHFGLEVCHKPSETVLVEIQKEAKEV